MTGTCVSCGAADVEINEDTKCAACAAAPATGAPDAGEHTHDTNPSDGDTSGDDAASTT